MELKVNRIIISNNGKRIDYDYSYSSQLSKFFAKERFFVEYEDDISEVPKHVLIIPFLANVLPIAWFANFTVKIEEVDADFLKALLELRLEFNLHNNLPHNPDVNLDFTKVINVNDSRRKSNSNAMLFSGGVDAYTTYLRHEEEELELITIKGADIKLNDNKQWSELTNYIEVTSNISKNNKNYITSNLRDFITFNVDKLLPSLGWWGRVQHGLALTCITAPICYIKNINILYIASSYTRKENYEFIPWGSMPEIDNKIKFFGTKIIHDGDSLTRQEKLNYICQFESVPLRVCYNEFKTTLNCSKCEKCYRTIYALLINGRNPVQYGFSFDSNNFTNFLETIDRDFTAKGNKLFWREIYDYSLICDTKYNINDSSWLAFYNKVNIILKERLAREIPPVSIGKRLKLSTINKFPKVFKFYLIFRRKFI